MDILLRLPRSAVGQVLPEARIKRGLQALNRDIFFDVGGRLNMQHPYIDYRQGVYWMPQPDGRRHVCSMDRGMATGGMIVEVPVWSTMPDIVEVTWDEVSPEELVRQEPPFPMPCLHDSNKLQIARQVRHDVILCGWRHTFRRLIAKQIPGITKTLLENEFAINMRDFVEDVLLPEDKAEWDDDNRADQPEEGEILEEMGAFEPRPTVVLAGE